MASVISDKTWEDFIPSEFMDDLKGRNVQAAIDWLADDFIWYVPGPEEFGGGEYHGVDGLKDFAAVVKNFFPQPLKREWYREWHAKGATILETKQSGPAITGKIYRNDYVFLFVHNIEGKVMEVREYQDIEPLRDVLEGFSGS
ncbi:MAG: hypothetical protein P8J18_09675 [Halieaceae bacterium]|nr:hypothetical protein [Halieaceae bacterium]